MSFFDCLSITDTQNFNSRLKRNNFEKKKSTLKLASCN
jgi:hypothetical protein